MTHSTKRQAWIMLRGKGVPHMQAVADTPSTMAKSESMPRRSNELNQKIPIMLAVPLPKEGSVAGYICRLPIGEQARTNFGHSV